MNIGNKIRLMRKRGGFTQEQLASKLGVSGQAVSKWENEIVMPDITLLPLIAEAFGVSIDDLFDLTIDQKLSRIENRIEIERSFTDEKFKEYENFLIDQLSSTQDRYRVVSLLAKLYHHRMESDSTLVSKYAREAIMLDSTKKDCQWLLNKAEGHAFWDWNCANHTAAIDFYKAVIENDFGTPKSSLPYYYLIDNLLADGRGDEANRYSTEFAKLPSANPVMIEVYTAHIALARHNVEEADRIIEECVKNHLDDSGYLFEAAQYYARRCNYKEAINLYERSWAVNKKPRYTDALYGIATIYKILGERERANETYDRILECLKSEWGYSVDDKPYVEAEQEKYQ